MTSSPAGGPPASTGITWIPHQRNWGVAFLVTFLVAGLALVAIPATNPQGGILVDFQWYLSLADGLTGQGRYTDPAGQDFIWPAGYPAFIALASGWSAPNPVAVAFVQLVLTGAIAALVVLLGGTLGAARPALAAGWIYALLPTAALWALTVMSETLFTALLLLACLVCMISIRGPRLWLGVLAGLLLGLAAFVRPIGLGLVPVWALLACLALRRSCGWKLGLSMSLAIAAVRRWSYYRGRCATCRSTARLPSREWGNAPSSTSTSPR